MNIAFRKLALLEKSLEEKETKSQIEGYVTSPVDIELKEKISKLMEQVRVY